MEILVAIIGILIGGLGILGGSLKAKNKENKILKDQNEKVTEVNTANEKITQEIMKNETAKKPVAKKGGTLFSVFFVLFIYGCAGIEYHPVAPNLVILDIKIEQVKYEYDEKLDLFTLTQDNMDSLVYNIELMKEVIAKYEKQITIYNKWRKEQ